MTNKLYVSTDAINEKGIEYFETVEYEDYVRIADPDDFIEIEDGLLLSRDDMDDLYISLTEYDESFEALDPQDIYATDGELVKIGNEYRIGDLHEPDGIDFEEALDNGNVAIYGKFYPVIIEFDVIERIAIPDVFVDNQDDYWKSIVKVTGIERY